MILDNYGTHKYPAVRKWLADRPQYHVHFTPTSSSWLNQIERWLAEITRKRIRRGTFRSVRELINVKMSIRCAPNAFAGVTTILPNSRRLAEPPASATGLCVGLNSTKRAFFGQLIP